MAQMPSEHICQHVLRDKQKMSLQSKPEWPASRMGIEDNLKLEN